MQLRLALIPVTLALLVACEPPPKHRTWSRLTPFPYDDADTSRLTREELEHLRTKALEERTFGRLRAYAVALARFSWEIGEILDARERAASDPEYKFVPPPEFADFDLQAYTTELEQLAAELEATQGYEPLSDFMLHFIRDDCEWISERVAMQAVCDWEGPELDNFEYVYGTCGEYASTCRKAHDSLVDPELRYRMMLKCNDVMANDKGSLTALAEWATPEEIEVFKVKRAEDQEKLRQMGIQSQMIKAGVEQENQERMEQYQEDVANYEANRSELDRNSQIGALDGSDQPPPPPEIETYSGGPVDTGPRRRRDVGSETVTVTIDNQCKEKLDYKVYDTVNGMQWGEKPLTRGKPLTLEVPLCSAVSIYKTIDEFHVEGVGRANAWTVQNLRVLEDCKTLVAERPDYAKPVAAAPEPTSFDGPPPPPPGN